MSKVHHVKRPTDDQLREWLYDAEFDWDSYEGETPMPKDTFPPYYADNYNATLAVLFKELLSHRAS